MRHQSRAGSLLTSQLPVPEELAVLRVCNFLPVPDELAVLRVCTLLPVPEELAVLWV